MTNKVIIIGNLTRDPDYATTSGGTPVCNFTVAVNRRNAEDKTDFFRVTTFNKTAENCSTYLSKGKKVCVVGEVHINEFTDKDGNKRVGVDITASEVEFLSPREETAKKPKQSDGGFVAANEPLPF